MTTRHSVHSHAVHRVPKVPTPQLPERHSMTCKDVADFLMAYLDNELPHEQRTQFDEHLTLCSSCVRYLELYKRTIRMGQAALTPTDQPAAGYVPPGLIEAINAARKRGL